MQNTILQYLKHNPWPERWLKLGKPVDLFWCHDLDVSIEKIWPYVADSSNYSNRMMGFPKIDYNEEGGKLIGKTNSFPKMEWEETWQWEFQDNYSILRNYQKGPIRLLRANITLETLSSNQIRIYVYIGMIPQTYLIRILLLAMWPIMAWKMEKVWTQISEFANKNYHVQDAAKPAQLSSSQESRISQIQQELLQKKISPKLVERLLNHILTAHELDLERLRPRSLAKAWGYHLQELISIFLHSTQAGLLILSWDVICPHCKGVREEIKHLKDLPAFGSCDVCDIHFETSTYTALEVSFLVHPSIRKIKVQKFCDAQVSEKPFIKFQLELNSEEVRTLENIWEPGIYRLLVRGKKAYNLIEITPDVAVIDVLEINESTIDHSYQIYPGTPLRLINQSKASKLFILEKYELDQEVMRPADLLGSYEFRHLFPEEIMASGMRLDIGVQSICFTDVVGSTKFYETRGDAGAFAVIHQHFVKVFEVVEQNHGVVVKSIGDAVMAAFPSAVDSLRASVEMQRYFAHEDPDGFVRLRITLNQGPCLAVNLNNSLDYFGGTVNYASKLQTHAHANQIVFSETIFNDALVSDFLKGFTEIEKLLFEHEALNTSLPIYRIQIT